MRTRAAARLQLYTAPFARHYEGPPRSEFLPHHPHPAIMFTNFKLNPHMHTLKPIHTPQTPRIICISASDTAVRFTPPKQVDSNPPTKPGPPFVCPFKFATHKLPVPHYADLLPFVVHAADRAFTSLTAFSSAVCSIGMPLGNCPVHPPPSHALTPPSAGPVNLKPNSLATSAILGCIPSVTTAFQMANYAMTPVTRKAYPKTGRYNFRRISYRS